MIDIHSHILPGMDDGSQSLSETRQLLQMLRQQGVRDALQFGQRQPARAG